LEFYPHLFEDLTIAGSISAFPAQGSLFQTPKQTIFVLETAFFVLPSLRFQDNETSLVTIPLIKPVFF
jgi:hypothetical protein